MSSRTEAFHDAIADAHARVDDVAEDEDTRAQYQERYKELLLSTDGRIPELWEFGFAMMEVDGALTGTTVQDLLEIDIAERDQEWTATMGAIMAAADQQAKAEVFLPDLFPAADKGARAILDTWGKVPVSDQGQAIAGPGKQRFIDAKARRKQNR
jgi:hypothetical protein